MLKIKKERDIKDKESNLKHGESLVFAFGRHKLTYIEKTYEMKEKR
jgi:hypothetical protein